MLSVYRRASELIRYAANAILATKITSIKVIAEMREKVGADALDPSRGMGKDHRIGFKLLHAGTGYGSGCCTKDTLALSKAAEDYASPVRIVEAMVAIKEAASARWVERFSMQTACARRAGKEGRLARPDLQTEHPRQGGGPAIAVA